MTWSKQIRTMVMLMLVVAMTAVDVGVAKPKSKKEKEVSYRLVSVSDLSADFFRSSIALPNTESDFA